MSLSPGLRIRSIPTVTLSKCRTPPQRCKYATAVAAAPMGSIDSSHGPVAAIEQYPSTQPPSLKPPDLRKSQLLRQYTSLIRSTPLTIFFQHNNLKASEWAAIRRELSLAMQKASTSSLNTPIDPQTPDPASAIRLQVIRTSMFSVALRIAEFYNPSSSPPPPDQDQDHQRDPTSPIHPTAQATTTPTHALSPSAYEATLTPEALNRRKSFQGKFDLSPRAHKKRNTPLHSLLHGPIAALTFPTVTPQHLAAALSILAPTPGASSAFPAPRRREAPGYYEQAVQNGLPKLLLLGARVEGRALDREGVKWVGGLAGTGGLEGLRAQLVRMLESVGAGVTGALEGVGKSLWLTMEGRRVVLQDGGDGEKGGEKSGP